MTGVTPSGCTLQGFVFSTNLFDLRKTGGTRSGPLRLLAFKKGQSLLFSRHIDDQLFLENRHGPKFQSVLATLRFSFAAKAPEPS